MITHEYEEFKPVRQIWTWLIVILLTVLTLGWAMMTHMAVPDVPPQWDFDVLPDTPAASPYSTVSPPAAREAPSQIEPPPYPLDRESQPR
jgi:hypothetical protein